MSESSFEKLTPSQRKRLADRAVDRELIAMLLQASPNGEVLLGRVKAIFSGAEASEALDEEFHKALAKSLSFYEQRVIR